MTIHPYLFPALFAAGVSMVAAAILRRVVRREYASLLPWLKIWGILCTFPALCFIVLCLPAFAGTANLLCESINGTGMGLLSGAAGVLPGLLWDETDERLEQHGTLPFGLPDAFFRALLIAVLTIVVLIPYGFLFVRQPAETKQPAAISGNDTLSKETAASASETNALVSEIPPDAEKTPASVQTGMIPDPVSLSPELPEN